MKQAGELLLEDDFASAPNTNADDESLKINPIDQYVYLRIGRKSVFGAEEFTVEYDKYTQK